jgi:hypothetical protein
MRPIAVANFKSTRSEMRKIFGIPQYIETDESRTPGGEEDNWAWMLESEHRLLVVLAVSYNDVLVYCDPPDGELALDVLKIGSEQQPYIFEEPIDPSGTA